MEITKEFGDENPMKLDQWMSTIRDDCSIAQISIPGTHNSAACHRSYPSVKCQDSSVLTQLQNGVRFLDLRVDGPLSYFDKAASGDAISPSLKLVHGSFPVSIYRNIWLEDIMKQVYHFLSIRPCETILISLKAEGPRTIPDGQFAWALYRDYINPKQELWYTKDEIPCLGDARGKCILIRRFQLKDKSGARAFPLNNFGLSAAYWPNNSVNYSGGHFRIQDFFEITNSTHLETKLTYIKEHVERSSQWYTSTTSSSTVTSSTSQQTESTADTSKDMLVVGGGETRNVLFLNFTTGAYFWRKSCWPRNIARALKHQLCCFLLSIPGPWGILIIDFAEDDGWALIKTIIQQNCASPYYRAQEL